jgi:aspartate/methionine/tyrosine aminotransferase
MISAKANRIGDSPTFKVAAKAKAMQAEGIDVVDLSLGEPDFPTPENIKAAGIKAIQQNVTKYTATEGTPDLKKAIIARLKEDSGLVYAPNEIIVSTGAKSSLFHAIQAILNEGEELIIPAPYWVTYPHLVTLAEGKSVIVPTKEENGFVLTPDELKAHITPATKALLLNSPSNPTGAAYSREQLEALAEVVRKEDILVISDEIYDKLVYDSFKQVSFASLGEDIKKKTILINGLSKAYSMTGWRIGYTAAPAPVIAAMSRIQGHTTSNPASISQKAGVEALAGPQFEVSRMAAEFQRRRNYCHMKLSAIPKVSCFKSQGAFYLFPNLSAYYGMEFNGTPIRNSYGMAYYLLKEGRVAIVPGDAFGADDHIRISYATSMEKLEKAMERIGDALAKLKPARKAKKIAFQNAVTRVKKSVPVEPDVPDAVRDGLVAEVRTPLAAGPFFEWNANINGVVVQLRTNVGHLSDFWMENWFPAQLDPGLEPHGIIYAVDGIPGREPRAFYNSATKTGVLVNTDGYAPLRSLALGLVADVSERLFGVHAVRGMSLDLDGQGLILVGPPGTKKTDLFFGLLRDPKFRFHSNDVAFVRFAGKAALADAVERKAFLPSISVELFQKLAPLFDSGKGENVVTRKEDCKNEECLRQDDCRLDKGGPFCYKASTHSHVLIDPNWIAGPGSAPRRTTLRWVFLLRNDAVSPALVELGADEAVRILESGEVPGMQRTAADGPPPPFFNPHLLVATEDRLALQRDFFRRLAGSAAVYLFNSGAAGIEKIKEILGA